MDETSALRVGATLNRARCAFEEPNYAGRPCSYLGDLELLLLLLCVLAKVVYCGRRLLELAQSGREVPKLFSEGSLTVLRGVGCGGARKVINACPKHAVLQPRTRRLIKAPFDVRLLVVASHL